MNPLSNSVIGLTFFQTNIDYDWKNNLNRYEYLMNSECKGQIFTQYNNYISGILPKIADERIKQVPIHEEGEPLVDIKLKNHTRIQVLKDPQEHFASPDCNSGFEECGHVRKKILKKLEFAINELDKIAPLFGFSQGQINIKIFEGLRNVKTQKMLYNNKFSEIKQHNPQFTTKMIDQETSKWVSPFTNNVPAHSTGGAVDIRLHDTKANCFLNMNTFGVIWGENETAETFSNKISNEQANNRLFMLIAMNNAGLLNYPYEYWHFSSGDQYASYWSKVPAVYNKIQ